MPQTINARVAPTMLDKVTRLFNGTLSDILIELLQNARRAGATSVRIDGSHDPHHDTCTAMLRVDDDGCGIADPAASSRSAARTGTAGPSPARTRREWACSVWPAVTPASRAAPPAPAWAGA